MDAEPRLTDTAADVACEAWWADSWRAHAALEGGWRNLKRRDDWRLNWRPYSGARASKANPPPQMTAPEVYATLIGYRGRRARTAADHAVLAVVQAVHLLHEVRREDVPPWFVPYGGRGFGHPLNVEGRGDSFVLDSYRRNVLTAGDAREAFVHFRRAWRALDSLPASWFAQDDDGHPLTPLSRVQLGPWCNLPEDKATMFGWLLVAQGIVVPVPVPPTWHGKDTNLYALSRPGPVASGSTATLPSDVPATV